MQNNTLWFNGLSMEDVDKVGGKNASLGEMVSNLANAGVSVPNGFATTSYAFNNFLDYKGLDERIHQLLDELDVEDVDALRKTGATIRQWVLDAPFPESLEQDIRDNYRELIEGNEELSVAVRSSATAEDLPDASFAGQQETFLNVKGIDAVIEATKHVFASLFNDRAISYRVHQGFDHRGISLSAGIQRMVRSDKASSGVMFTLDTESGFDQVVFITSSWGLGEMVVQGAVNPDEFYVHKPMLEAGHYPVVKKTF
ncbi:PEP/pyruvate-binding domain-containing protein, partial [Vibrio splendidus]